MEKMIGVLGYIYIAFGFVVGISSYYYSLRQYKTNKLYYTQHKGKIKKNDQYIKKPVRIKSNITQYLDTNVINKELNYPIIHFINTKNKESIRIGENRTIIGRGKTDDIVIDDPKVSRSHCVITKSRGKYYIRLTALKNPILLNNKKVTENKELLTDGDIITLVNANILFKFSLSVTDNFVEIKNIV